MRKIYFLCKIDNSGVRIASGNILYPLNDACFLFGFGNFVLSLRGIKKMDARVLPERNVKGQLAESSINIRQYSSKGFQVKQAASVKNKITL